MYKTFKNLIGLGKDLKKLRKEEQFTVTKSAKITEKSVSVMSKKLRRLSEDGILERLEGENLENNKSQVWYRVTEKGEQLIEPIEVIGKIIKEG
jgi:DNA-binding HxlR family transcriptional regulator